MCAVAAAALLTGCGETAYKMGAGGDAFQKDRRICASDDEAAYKACMKGKGWTVMDLDNLRLAPVAQAPAPEDGVVQSPSANTPESVAPTSHPESKQDAVATKKPAAAPMNPNTKVLVGSWWKMGPTNFKGDADSCTAQLGEAHHYDEVTKVTTRAFAQCMRGKGWYAY
jgi:hypothetical protein